VQERILTISQEAQELLEFVLGTHLPLLLAPLFTWFLGGLVVAVRASSPKVAPKALLLMFIGAIGLAGECVILYWTASSASLLPSPILWILAVKRAIAEVNGDNLICAVSIEIAFINALISFTRTDQKWIAFLKWLAVAFLLGVLGITFPFLVRIYSRT